MRILTALAFMFCVTIGSGGKYTIDPYGQVQMH